MKNVVKLLGSSALAALIAFSFAACGDGAAGSQSSGGPVFGGTFQKNAGNPAGHNQAIFNITVPVEYRAVGDSGENKISGVIKDGGKTLQVTGTYNPATGFFSLSAASTVNGYDVRYVISGTIDPNDPRYFNNDGIKVTMLAKDGDWNAFIYPVAETSEIIGGQGEVSSGGMPPEFLGNWETDLEELEDDPGRYNGFSFSLSPYFMKLDETTEFTEDGNLVVVNPPPQEFTVVSCNGPTTAGLYELIVIQPIYVVGDIYGNGEQSDLTVVTVEKVFLDYAESLGFKLNELERSFNKDFNDLSPGIVNGYIINDDADAGNMKTNFLNESQEYYFQGVFLPRYCRNNGYQTIPSYIKFDAEMHGSDLWLTQYKDGYQNSFLYLDDLVDLAETQDPFVCKRP